jgi:hypothetical protein
MYMCPSYSRAFVNIPQKEDEVPAQPKPEPKLTKAQLKAKHIELNKQLWESAYVKKCATLRKPHC